MQTIILATDEQRRLPPLTDSRPAVLLPIIDRPVMATTVELLARAGHKRVLVSLFQRGGAIAGYFGSGKRWGLNIEYVTQRDSWGSAGALKWAPLDPNEPCLVLPGDALLDLDIESALAFHRSQHSAATAIVHQPFEQSSAPLLTLRGERLIDAGPGSGQEGAFAATGAFIFEPRALSHIAAHTKLDIVTDLLPALLRAGEPVAAYVMSGYWNPLDSHYGFQHAQQVYLHSAYGQSMPDHSAPGPVERVRFPSLQSRQLVPGVWTGIHLSVHPSAKIAPPVYIGDNSWIGRETELGSGTVIGTNVVVDDEATVTGSIILDDTYVGRLVNVDHRIVADGTIIDPLSGDCTTVVDPFLLGHAGNRQEAPNRMRRLVSACGALILLIAWSPALLLAWIVAILGSGAQSLVRAPRVGWRAAHHDPSRPFETFDLLQFRVRRADGAYTWLGRWLESTELYRLPELVNVIQGNLTLVGIKPLRPHEAAQLTEDWQLKRFEAAPGFTGLWYHDTQATSPIDTVLVSDVYYVATRSWYGDLKILLGTPAAWLRRQTEAHAETFNQAHAQAPDQGNVIS
jgi:NDP-sugar pyrophosphorylase family protein